MFPKKDTLKDLFKRLQLSYHEVLKYSDIDLLVENLDELEHVRLPMNFRQHLYLIFKEAINMDPACVQAYIKIGDSYTLENRLEDAVAVWQKLLKTVPEAANAVLGRLKKALFDLGRFGDISTVCEEILETSPKNLEARLTLADYHLKKG